MRNINGELRFKPLIRFMLENEWLFSIHWGWEKISDIEVRIGHHKGVWTIGKLEKGKFMDFFQLYDAFTGYNAKNPLTKGLLEFFIKQEDSSEDKDLWRKGPANVILEVLGIWAKKLDDACEIKVLQSGRNGSINENDGSFQFSPRPNEWKDR